MTTSSPPPLPPGRPAPGTRDNGRTKLTLNLVVASISVLLALWMVIADFAYPGNLLFQDSASMVLLGLYLSALFLILLVLAALPKRIVITANLLILARAAMGWPLSLVIDHSLACRIVSIALLLLGIYHLTTSLRPSLLRIHLRPWLGLRHSVIAVLLWLGVGLGSIPVFLLGYVEAGKSLMGHYVRFSWDGVSLVERVFEKDGQHVHLIGMMHIGERSFYTTLNQRMRTPLANGRRIILTEGVSDNHDVLPAEFKSGQTYAKLARALGLSLQPQGAPARPANQPREDSAPARPEAEPREESIPGVTFKNADIDISALDEDHQEILVTILGMLDFDNLAELLVAQPEGITGRDIELLFLDGLLRQRNDVLMRNFQDSTPGYSEVFIPWGAAHLPDIEQRLLARGYTRRSETIRQIVHFWDKPAPAPAPAPGSP